MLRRSCRSLCAAPSLDFHFWLKKLATSFFHSSALYSSSPGGVTLTLVPLYHSLVLFFLAVCLFASPWRLSFLSRGSPPLAMLELPRAPASPSRSAACSSCSRCSLLAVMRSSRSPFTVWGVAVCVTSSFSFRAPGHVCSVLPLCRVVCGLWQGVRPQQRLDGIERLRFGDDSACAQLVGEVDVVLVLVVHSASSGSSVSAEIL